MMKKSQGKERERKKKREGVGGADGMRVYIFHSSPPGHGSISTIVFTVVELFKPAKRNPSLSLCLSSLLFIVHWSIIQLSRVDDRCKNDILASCALEREGEQVSLLLITPAQAKKNLFIVLGHFQKGRKWFWSTSYRCAQLPIKNLSVEPLKVSRTR